MFNRDPFPSYAQASKFNHQHFTQYFPNSKLLPVYNQPGEVQQISKPQQVHRPYISQNRQYFYQNRPYSSQNYNQQTSTFGYNNFQKAQHQQSIPLRHVQYGNAYMPTSKFDNYHRSQPYKTSKQADYSKSKNASLESQLFHKLKDFGNNVYSVFLMEKDLDLASVTPHRNKEMHRLFNALNKPQIDIEITETIKMHQLKVKEAAQNLTKESINLAIEMYKENTAKILRDINVLIAGKLKSIPNAVNVVNYIKPNLFKRRLTKEIFPKVVDAINKLINDLNSKLFPVKQKSKESSTILPTVVAITLNNVNNDVAMPMDSDSKQNENRKRKNIKAQDKYAFLSSEEEDFHANKRISKSKISQSISSFPSMTVQPSTSTLQQNMSNNIEPQSSNIDLDDETNPLLTQENLIHNVVSTVEDYFTSYSTYTSNKMLLPTISNPPDVPLVTSLNIKNKEACISLINICRCIYQNSKPNYSILTFHSDTDITLPKTHLSIKVSPHNINTFEQNIVPKDFLFIYELLLTSHNFASFKDCIQKFISWAHGKNVPFMITIPSVLSTQMKECLNNIELTKITRPFPVNASTSEKS